VDGPGFVHNIVEATKQAFLLRDTHVRDPAYMDLDPAALLADGERARMARAIDRAAPWPHAADRGDTVWMGTIDGKGRAISFIQSIYWESGSGVVSPSTGVLWQTRGRVAVTTLSDADNDLLVASGADIVLEPFHRRPGREPPHGRRAARPHADPAIEGEDK
jgi:gamma-glutamyltranspeptidase